MNIEESSTGGIGPQEPKLAVSIEGNEVIIAGNAAGFRNLATEIRTYLAPDDANIGYHMHYDPGVVLEEGSTPLIIIRQW